MAFRGLEKVFVPGPHIPELAALLRRYGMSLHPVRDTTEGDVHVLCLTGRPPVDKPLHWH